MLESKNSAHWLRFSRVFTRPTGKVSGAIRRRAKNERRAITNLRYPKLA